MAARRTASQIATFAALAVAAFGGTVAHSASAKVSGPGPNVFVIVFGGWPFTINLPSSIVRYTGVSQMGGAG